MQQQFKISWPRGYGNPPPQPEVHALDWLDESVGFEDDDVEALEGLAVGQMHSVAGVLERCEIERIA